MYELFLLGKLMERPWHGYEFQRVLGSVVGPVRQVSWGTIYPLLRRLETNGYIKKVHDEAGDGRGRQHFAITAAGKARFLELMRAIRPKDADYRDTFRIMLGNFGRVDVDTRRAIVDRYVNQLSEIITHAEAMIKRVSKVAMMQQHERDNILAALEHDRFLAKSDRAWIQKHLGEWL